MDLLTSLFGLPVSSINVHDINKQLKSAKRSTVIEVRLPVKKGSAA